MDTRDYLIQIMPTRQQVELFLTRQGPDGWQPNRGWIYEAELGFVHADTMHPGDGEGSVDTFYHYEDDGARQSLNCRDRPCQIHTYGNSFTHGDQVNDGETWQEYLAAAINQPVRNYGVGGYSVYQAYRRMCQVQREGQQMASHIIFNIFDDDHFRNLESWRSIRTGAPSCCGFTLPHLRVEPDNQYVEEVENPLPTPQDVYKLCDPDYVVDAFADDLVLKATLDAIQQQRNDANWKERSRTGDDVSGKVPVDFQHARAQTERRLAKPALFATRCVVEMIERFVKETNKRLMFVPSFDMANMIGELNGQAGYYQPFVDWLKQRGHPVVDMRDAFRDDLHNSRLDVEAHLAQYYICHHTASGNFLTAKTIGPILRDWMEAKPAPSSGPRGSRSPPIAGRGYS